MTDSSDGVLLAFSSEGQPSDFRAASGAVFVIGPPGVGRTPAFITALLDDDHSDAVVFDPKGEVRFRTQAWRASLGKTASCTTEAATAPKLLCDRETESADDLNDYAPTTIYITPSLEQLQSYADRCGRAIEDALTLIRHKPHQRRLILLVEHFGWLPIGPQARQAFESDNRATVAIASEHMLDRIEAKVDAPVGGRTELWFTQNNPESAAVAAGRIGLGRHGVETIMGGRVMGRRGAAGDVWIHSRNVANPEAPFDAARWWSRPDLAARAEIGRAVA